MSQYTNFFIRKGNDFIPIGSYSRNSAVARAFYDFSNIIPYEKIVSLTTNDFEYVIKHIKEEQNRYRDLITEDENQINFIKSMPDPIEEKMKCIRECQSEIKDLKFYIEEWDYALYYFSFLTNIIENFIYGDFNLEDYGGEAYIIYAGIEIDSPTVDDIESEN